MKHHKLQIQAVITQRKGKTLLADQATINPLSWQGSCLGTETTLHQIAPYIGKMKSSMARALIEFCSKPADTILDPFVGSGAVALESLIAGRRIVSSDVNPYAVVLTRAKLLAPSNLNRALALAEYYLKRAEKECDNVDIESIPSWIQEFFHPKTLQETVALTRTLRNARQHFLLSCLLGILHHQRPGFLSFPASHAIPYLRTRKFPRESYPDLYQYRPVRPRLLNKVRRVYRRFPKIDPSLLRKCCLQDVAHLSLPDESIDAVVTSPPYMNALDYVRDNRLRLWFLGYEFQKELNRYNPRNAHEFHELMTSGLEMILRTLRPKRRCVMVVGEVKKADQAINTADVLLSAAERVGSFDCETIVEDGVPQDRRVRKRGSCTRREWVVVLRKRD